MERISCKGILGEIPPCKFDAPWLCKHPDCNGPVLTATLHGAWPKNCPLKRDGDRSTEGQIAMEALKDGKGD